MSYEAENVDRDTSQTEFEERALSELTAIRRLLEILVGFDIDDFEDLGED